MLNWKAVSMMGAMVVFLATIIAGLLTVRVLGPITVTIGSKDGTRLRPIAMEIVVDDAREQASGATLSDRSVHAELTANEFVRLAKRDAQDALSLLTMLEDDISDVDDGDDASADPEWRSQQLEAVKYLESIALRIEQYPEPPAGAAGLVAQLDQLAGDIRTATAALRLALAAEDLLAIERVVQHIGVARADVAAVVDEVNLVTR